VSLIGSLEQFDLANILRRLEVFSKTGLLVVKQKDRWVELYFRQGQLVCVGPERENVTLIDRLLQAKLLPAQALPQIRATVGTSESNETRIALALINEGYLSREILRAWRSHETSQLLKTLLSWTEGEVYFEEDYQTPPNRLLVGLSISSLLDALPPVAALAEQPPAQQAALATSSPADRGPGNQMAPTKIEQVTSFAAPGPGTVSASQLIEQPPSFAQAAAEKEAAPGLISASQLIEDASFDLSSPLNVPQRFENAPSPEVAASGSLAMSLGSEIDVSAPARVSFVPPQPVRNPLPPARIDVSFMTPDLVLVPVDLSSLRERNPQVQLTPDQWRLFALIDGQTSLQTLCQALMAPSEQVCMVAGELIAIGLVMPLGQQTGAFNGLPPSALATMSMPGSAALTGQPAAFPARASHPAVPAQMYPGAQGRQAQWDNGNNGTVFVAGGSWVFPAQHMTFQPDRGQPGAVYASAGGHR
jgi:hypothetical protein